VANYIVKIRKSGGHTYEHISEVMWRPGGETATKTCSREAMANAITKGVDVRVPATTTAPEAEVRVVPGTTFIQSVADGKWSNNLLALPTF